MNSVLRAMPDIDLGLLATFAAALAGAVWVVLRWRHIGTVPAAGLLLAVAFLAPLADKGIETVHRAASLPPYPLAIASLMASAVAVISLVALWAGYSRCHWFWRLSALTGVLALLGLIEAREPLLLASAVMAPLAAAAWLLRRHDAQRDEGPVVRRTWRWTLVEMFAVFVIVGLASLAVRSLSRGELYLVPEALAITWGQWLLLTLLAAIAGLSRGVAIRVYSGLAAFLLAAGGVYLRGPLADDGMELKYLLDAVDFRDWVTERPALWVVVQWGIAGAIILACSLFAIAIRSPRTGRKPAAVACLVLMLAALVAPLATVFPGMLPPKASVAALPRSETYEKVQALGERGWRLMRRKVGGFNAAAPVKEATAALAEPGNVWFHDAGEFPKAAFSSVLSRWLDNEAARAAHASQSAECLELAVLQWRLSRVLRNGGIFANWAAAGDADQHGCATATVAVDSLRLSDQDCRRALAEIRQSLAEWPAVETMLAYHNYWDRAFFGWRSELSRAAQRLLGQEPQSSTFVPGKDVCQKLDRRGLLRLRLLETRLALELYRRAEGQWPTQLEDLVPGYLAAVPDDPFAAGPLIYRRQGDGFALYSVGPDGQDNGGRTSSGPQDDDLEGFDIDWEHDRRIQASYWPRKP